MISKVITPGKSFNGLCKYLCKDRTRSLVLETEGVRAYDYKLMALDFEAQRRLNPNLKSSVLHIILSYYPGEKISDDMMIKIAKEYLEKLEIKNTQAAIVKHSDRDHPHTHLIINRVDNNGKTIKDNWIGLRGKKTAQQLTIKYELIQAQKKTLELTHLERLNDYEAARYQIYRAICDALPKCKNLDELKSRLNSRKIEMIYKYKGQTDQLQGVSFKQGNFKFKGSAIDRQFSLKNLEKTMGQSREQKQTARATENLKPQMERQHSKEQSLLEELMKPQQMQPSLPYELLQKKRKKKQSQGHHL